LGLSFGVGGMLSPFIGRWLREVRCEAGAVPPL
jgi:hypothetical protein